MKSIATLLANTPELKPIPTGVESEITPLKNIKAVIFDIYGTLLISASGDINGFELSCSSINTSLQEAGLDLKSWTTNERNALCTSIKECYKLFIHSHQQRIMDLNGHPFPEIDIIDVWYDIVSKYLDCGSVENIDLGTLSMTFELLSNQVYPMPAMNKVLNRLSKHYKLGIISNAQFYTPMIMNYFLTGSCDDRDYVEGFDPELSVFSYRELRAKPDLYLFEKIKAVLADRDGIQSDEVLYIGNDMYKDIYPASKAGFKTVLFAGDKRSLKWRTGKPEVQGIEPTSIITKLEELYLLL